MTNGRARTSSPTSRRGSDGSSSCSRRSGPAARPTTSYETDELNAELYRRDRDRSLDDVRSGERDAYAAMLAALDGATDEELFDGTHFAWTEGDRFADWFRANGDEHYDEHLGAADPTRPLSRAARRRPAPVDLSRRRGPS